MEFITKFKNYLLAPRTTEGLSAGNTGEASPKQQASKATVKNYLADVNHFIAWFEGAYQKPFSPSDISMFTINEFKHAKSQELSASSVDRHISTLRKFFTFLKLDGQIASSPFELASTDQRPVADPYHLHEFKNYLYVYNASNLTIKNYIIDVKQFLQWAEEVLRIQDAWRVADKDVLGRINSHLVEEYKERLLHQKVFSPASINRKLSSLRKYLGWASENGLLNQDNSKSDTYKILTGKQQLYAPQSEKHEESTVNFLSSRTPENNPRLNPLPDKQGEENQGRNYSVVPPIRLFQKLANAGTFSFDLLIVAPVAYLFRKVEHEAWKMRGKKVFSTNSKFQIPNNKHIGNWKLKIENLPKAFYAPLSISIKDFPWYKKLFHHARYTRPNWYRKYHQLAIAHYFNWAVLIIFATAIGFGMYNSFIQKPGHSLAALPTQPIRVLSFQGRLTDANDNPITSPTWIRFEIYNAQSSSGSARLWEEVDKVSPDQDGIFSLLLGSSGASDGSAASLCNSGNPPTSPATGACGIPSSLFANNSALWLGASVENTAELTPREQLATVAFASNAETLQGLPPITAAGAGTNNVVLALNSSGNLAIGAATTFQSTSGAFNISGNTVALNTNAGTNGTITLAPDGKGFIDLQRPIQNGTNNGDVPSVNNAVTVDDLFAILATSSGQSAFTINQNGAGPIISASVSGNAKFTVDNSGNTTANAFYTGLGTTYYINNATSNLNSLTLANNLTVSGNVASSLIPSVNDTYDLGSNPVSSGKEWNNLYVKNIYQNGVLISANLWQENSGALSPYHTQDDLLLGDTATSGANLKFGFLNVASGVPTATISSNFSIKVPTGGSPASSINLLNGSTLGFYTATAGKYDAGLSSNPALYISNSGNVGIGTSNPSGQFYVLKTGSNNGNFGDYGITVATTGTNGLGIGDFNTYKAIQSFSGTPLAINPAGNSVGIGTSNPIAKTGLDIEKNSQGNSALVVANLDASNVGDLFTASNSAGTQFTVTNGGTVKGRIYQDLDNTAYFLDPASVTNALIIAGAEGIGTTNPVGSLDVRALNGTTSVASISGKTSFASLVVDNSGLGDIFTASSSGLNRFVITQNGSVGIGTTVPSATLQLLPPGNQTASLKLASTGGAGAFIGFGTSSGTNAEIAYATVASGALEFQTGGSGGNNDRLIINQIGKIGTGITGANASQIGNAQLVVNQTNNSGSGDIFTASASATTEFTIQNDGTLITKKYTTADGLLYLSDTAGTVAETGQGASHTFLRGNGSSAPTFNAIDLTADVGSSVLPIANGGTNGTASPTNGQVAYGTGTAYAFTSGGSAGNCLTYQGTSAPTWGSCGSGGSNYWTLDAANGDLYPVNATLDFITGGTSTASAHFAVLGTASNTTIASVSAQNNNKNAIYLDSVGEALQTVQAKDLTLGGSTTGAIVLAPNNGNGLVSLNSDTLNTTKSTFNLLNSTATTLNFAGAASTLNIGAAGSTVNFKASAIDSNQATVGEWATPTTLNIGSSSQATNLLGNIKLGTNTSNTVNIAGLVSADILPSGNGSINLGSATHYYNTVYANAFVSPVGNGTAGFWTITNNTNLYPSNTADDLLIGGNATNSAAFQIFAGAGSPQPAGTATTSGNISFRGTAGSQTIFKNLLLNGSNLGFYPSVGGDAGLSATPALYVANTGNIGIGTNAPTNHLDVNANGDNGGILLEGNGISTAPYATFNGLRLSGGDTINTIYNAGRNIVISADTGHLISISQTSTPATGLTVNTTNGNVGIGTTSPNTTLQVAGTASASGDLTLYNNSNGVTHNLYLLNNGNLDVQTSVGGNAATTHALYIQAPSGNVGIGTTNPGQTLEVNGVVLADTKYIGPTGSATQVTYGANGANSGLFFIGGGAAAIAVNGSERARFDTTGFFGINTTSPTAYLDVAGAASASGTFTFYAGSGTIQTTSDGALNLGGNTTGNISFGSNIASNFIPQLTDTYNLGSATNEWNNLYIRQIISPNTGGIAGYWQLNSGVLAPSNLTNDLVVGGISTASARFQVLASGNGAGTISATVNDPKVNNDAGLYPTQQNLINIASSDHSYLTLTNQDFTLGGHKNLVSLPSTNGTSNVFVYDTSKDTDGGKWTNDEKAQGASWYNESRTSADACVIGTNTRCGTQAFPKKAIITSVGGSINKVFIFDAKDNSLWMEFDKGPTTTSDMIGPTTNSGPGNIFALNGKLYVSSAGSAGNIYVVDFKNDISYRYDTTGYAVGNQNISNRNTTTTYSYLPGSTAKLVAPVVNTLSVNVVNGKTYLAEGEGFSSGNNNGAVALINESDESLVANFGPQNTTAASVWLTSTGTLYAAISTAASVTNYTIKVKYNAINASGNNTLFDEVYAYSDSTHYGATTTDNNTFSTLANNLTAGPASTSATFIPDRMWVTEGTSTVDGKSDTLYIPATGSGGSLMAFNLKKGDPSNGSVKYYTTSYISEEMVGDVRGMWPLDTNIGSGLTDVSVKGNTLTNGTTAPTYTASGVRNKGANLGASAAQAKSTAASLLIPATTGLTVSAWVQPTTLTTTSGTREMWVSADANTASKVSWGIGTKGDGTNAQIYCFANGSSFVELNSAVTAAANTWYHVALTSDTSGNLKCYVNGQLTATSTVSSAETPTQFDIGATQATTAFNAVRGNIDEVMVAAATLTNAEIGRMYQVGWRALQNHTANTIRGVAVSQDAHQQIYANNSPSEMHGVAVNMASGLMYVGGRGMGVSAIGLDTDSLTDFYNSAINSTDDTGTTFGTNDNYIRALSIGQSYGSGVILAFGLNNPNNGLGHLYIESQNTTLKDILATSYDPFGINLTQSNLTIDNMLRVTNQASTSFDNLALDATSSAAFNDLFRIDNQGQFLSRVASNSATAVQFQDASGNALLNIDTRDLGNAVLTINNPGSGDLLTASASGTTEFQVTGAGNIVARKFTDLDNSIYYLDPASLTVSASVAGSMTFTPSTEHDINFLNNSNINFQSSVGGDAGLTSRLFINGATGGVGIGTNSPLSGSTLSVAGIISGTSSVNTQIGATGATGGNGNNSSIYFLNNVGSTSARLDTSQTSTGVDGALTVNGTTKTDNTKSDLILTDVSGNAVATVSATTGFSVGDEVLIIQTVGTGQGNWETSHVAAVANGTTLALTTTLKNTYTKNGTTSMAEVIRVPHYTTVTVNNGGILTADTWSSSTGLGGVVFFRANTVTVNSGGVIDGNSIGLAGGAGGNGTGGGTNGGATGACNASTNATGGSNGSAGFGAGGGGVGNGGGGATKAGSLTSSCSVGGSGGGSGAPGGGGSYGTAGTGAAGAAGGSGGNYGANTSTAGSAGSTSSGGSTNGNQDLSTDMRLGSGGGGGGQGGGGAGGVGSATSAGGNGGNGGAGGAGGAGGGLIYINATTITNNGTIRANGANGITGTNGNNGTSATVTGTTNAAGGGGAGGSGGSGGGGSGGAIYLNANTVTVGTTTATGGSVGSDATGGTGGNGQNSNGVSGFAGGGGGGGADNGSAGSNGVANGGGNPTTPTGGGSRGSGGAGGSGRVDITGTVTGTSTPSFFNGIFVPGTNSNKYGTLFVGAVDTQHADLAENYISGDSTIEAGDVVAISNRRVLDDHSEQVVTKGVLRKASGNYDHQMLGVVSTDPGLVLGTNDDQNSPEAKQATLALAGRVPVKVSTENGPIHIGDPLTASNTQAGVAVLQTQAGPTIGEALEEYTDTTQVGKIDVFVNASWYDPQVYLTTTGDMQIQDSSPSADFTIPHYFTLNDALGNPIQRMGAFLELAVGNLRAGSVQAQQVFTNSLAIATDNVSIAGQSLHDYVTSIVQEVISQTPQNSLTSPIASTQQLHVGIISPLGSDDSIALKIGNSGIQITKGASGSAVATFDNQGNATLSGQLNSNSLAVNGDATISGTLHANRIEANEISGLQEVVSTLSAQNITNVNNIYFSTPSGTQIADNNNIGFGNGSSSPSGVLNSGGNFANIASFSAYFAYVPNLNATTGIFQQGLTSLGPTSLTDTTIDGQLSIGRSLILADNSINVLGTDFQIQPLRQGGVQFEGGLIAINTNGDLTVGGNAVVKGNLAIHTLSPIPGENLTIDLINNTASAAAQPNLSVSNASGSSVFNINQLGDLVASGEATVSKLNIGFAQPALAVSDTEVVATGSAGTASIKQYQKEVTIDDPNVTANSLIYITPVGDTGGQTPYLERQVAGKSFSVGVPIYSTQAVQFNWLIVN